MPASGVPHVFAVPCVDLPGAAFFAHEEHLFFVALSEECNVTIE